MLYFKTGDWHFVAKNL